MKSVLMLCYHYPPAQNGGVQRSLRFAHYLPKYDWHPAIITSDLYGKSEEATHTLELRSLYKRLRGKYPAPIQRQVSVGSSTKPSAFVQFITKYLYVPDGAVAWLPFALLTALRQSADIIYSTSPPHSAHLLALVLQKLKRKPWVMDLRDPWTIDPIGTVLRTSRWRLALEKRLERWCFQQATAVILNTDSSAQAYRQQFPDLAHKFQVITNGFNPSSFEHDDFSIRDSLNLDSDIQLISHVGNLARDVQVNAQGEGVYMPLLRAIQQVEAEGTRFVFIGNVPAPFVQAIHKFGLQNRVLLPGLLPHHQAIQAMQASDALLFFDPPGDGQTYVRGKLYEYAATQKPIFAVTGQGASATFLSQLGNVLTVPPDNETAIVAGLQEVVSAQIPERNPDFDLNSINYRYLTRRLATLFDMLVSD